jgi:hypothetical protein
MTKEEFLKRHPDNLNKENGAYSKEIKKIINYPPEHLYKFHRTGFEYIDNLNFGIDPADYIENYEEYINIAIEIFLEMGWHGDGKISLMWIPPFMFELSEPEGIIFWHVKQIEDGISFILSPIDIYFPNKLGLIYKENTTDRQEYNKNWLMKYKPNSVISLVE